MDFPFLLCVFFAVFVHELGHALTARKLGVSIKSISLFGIGPFIFSWKSSFFKGAKVGFSFLPYGAYVSLDESSMNSLTRKEHDDIDFAGVHMNFVLGTLAGCLFMLIFGVSQAILIITCVSALLTLHPVKLFVLYVILPFAAVYFISYLFRSDIISKSVNEGFIGAVQVEGFFNFQDFGKKFLWHLSFLNLGLGIGNMLPIRPLDGGSIMHRFVETKISRETWTYRIVFVILPLVFIVLMFLPVVGDAKKLLSIFF
jgi:membrane-associated protease RseP (regulator of RpoE activity)